MFTTFTASESADSAAKQNGGNTAPSKGTRPKRSQVARACDLCRLNRIKCDDNQPCTNCQNRGSRCSNGKSKELRTLPAANKEIDTLKSRIAELEGRLKDQPIQTTETAVAVPVPQSSSTTIVTGKALEKYLDRNKVWGGVQRVTPGTPQTQYYGPSSSYYFITRISSYLYTASQKPHQEDHLIPISASRIFASPSAVLRKDLAGDGLMLEYEPAANESLSRAQEDYFLNLFWQSYHATIPVLNEVEFREHYDSLWSKLSPDGLSVRKPSALVDIILALCMQYGTAFLIGYRDPKGDVDSNDTSIAGRWFYHRCQTLLSSSLENPSIITLQCHIYSLVYLRNASFLNMAYKTLGTAIRTAHILGLHHEPPSDLPPDQQELHKRLWWILLSLDSKACMELGRPYISYLPDITCSLSSDDPQVAMLSGSKLLSPDSTITWLSYHAHAVKLVLAVRAVSTAFYEHGSTVIDANGGKSLYDDPQSLEICADFLMKSMKGIGEWLQEVPNALKTPRQGTGQRFSTDRTPVEIDPYTPLWLQRQRLLLELLYHNLVMCLYRPFIRFPPVTTSLTPLSDGHSISCLNHAMAITNLTHQILTETDILNGWHEAYQFQWNAALSMLGFSLANPVCPPTPSARKAIQTAIATFDIFSGSLAIATSAATICRNLDATADVLIEKFRSGLTPSQKSVSMSTPIFSSAASTPSSTSRNTIATTSQTQPTAIATPQMATLSSPMTSLDMVSQVLSVPQDPFTKALDELPTSESMDFLTDPFTGFEPSFLDNDSIGGDLWAPFIQN